MIAFDTTCDTTPICASCGRAMFDTSYNVIQHVLPKNVIDLEGVNRKDRRTLETIAKRYGWEIRQPSWKR
jgi:hypothetical protein